MSIIENSIEANRRYSHRHDPRLAQRAAPKVAVVTCMDPRLSNLSDILGLAPADIDVIRTGDSSPAPMRFFSYQDPERNTREQIEKVRSHPWIAKDIPVRGFVFNMETGLLSEVTV